MAMPLAVPRYTAEEIRRFPDHRVRYEVIRGELFVTPAPGLAHQRTVVELTTMLRHYLERHKLGEVLVAPFEVELTEDSAVQPDLLVLLAGRDAQLTPARLVGPPSLVIEVISYTSKRTDDAASSAGCRAIRTPRSSPSTSPGVLIRTLPRSRSIFRSCSGG